MGKEFKPIKLLTGEWLCKIEKSVFLSHVDGVGDWDKLTPEMQAKFEDMASRCVTVMTEHLAGMLVEYLRTAQREGDDYYR